LVICLQQVENWLALMQVNIPRQQIVERPPALANGRKSRPHRVQMLSSLEIKQNVDREGEKSRRCRQYEAAKLILMTMR
jgi:hypothetical protein